MKKIVILGPYFPVNGGTANATVNLAEALAVNLYEVHVINCINLRTNLKKYEHINGVHIHRVRVAGFIVKIIDGFSKLITYKYLAFVLKNKIKEIEPDIILGQFIYHWGNVAQYCKKYVNAVSITCARGEDVNQLMGIDWKEELTRRSLENNDLILSVNSDFAEILSQYSEKKVFCLSNILKDISCDINYDLRIKNDVFRILCIGRMDMDIMGEEIKGFSIVLKAIKELEHCHVSMIGDGPLLKDYKDFVSQHNLEDRVTFYGKITHEKTLKILNSSNAVALPSNIEGLSNVMVESMCYGVPVIATRIGGAKDYIKDSFNGMLIEKKDYKSFVDKVNFLRNDNDKYLSICKNARNTYLQNFTPEYVADKFNEIILNNIIVG